MSRLLTVGFDFDNNSYCSIILIREDATAPEYKITVMDGALQSLLTHNNVIVQKNGELVFDELGSERLTRLKRTIAEALGKLVNMPVHTTRLTQAIV